MLSLSLNLLNALELKVPPLVLVLLHTWAMWFAASQLPSFAFPLPLPHGFAATVCGGGILFLLAEVYLFQKAKTTSILSNREALSHRWTELIANSV